MSSQQLQINRNYNDDDDDASFVCFICYASAVTKNLH